VVNFAMIVDGKVVPIRIVSNMAWGGAMSVIVYESPGTDGGTVLVNGRTTRTRTLNGKILRAGDLSLAEIKNYFDYVRDSGKVITLVSPIDDNDTGKYIINDFNGQVLEGIDSHLPFTMELTEYRQANIKTSRVNLIAFEPAERVRQIIRDRNITPK
jgi:hypothetical protein